MLVRHDKPLFPERTGLPVFDLGRGSVKMALVKSHAALLHFTAHDTDKAATIYSAFFGIQFAKVSSSQGNTYRAPVGASGCTAVITPPYRGNEGLTVYFAVENLSEAIAELERNGGSVTTQPFDIHAAGSNELVSNQCEVSDVFGNRFGLIEFSQVMNTTLGKPVNLLNLDPADYSAHMAALTV